MERLFLKLANFGTFVHYFISGLWDNQFVNWIRYDLLGQFPYPPHLLRDLNYQYWLMGYRQRGFGWTLVSQHRVWQFWILRIGTYALCCRYVRGRLVAIRRFEPDD